jgi:ubiquitin C-terminal hydrolase
MFIMSYKDLIAFHNIGNSCYLNSALQVLLSCDEFRECIFVANKEKNNKGLNLPFLSILNDITLKRENPETPISNPILLKQMLSDHSSFFKDTHQQDCHECLINILDIIHENTKTTDKNSLKLLLVNNRIIKKNPSISTNANKQWKETMTKSGVSFTSYLFSGQLRSNLICQGCEHQRDNFEIINNLSLSLPDVEKLDIIDSFVNYFGIETLDGQNMVECDKCKNKTIHKKNLSLWRFPKILMIHLKRYTQTPNGNYKRNNCLVDFSPELIFKEKTAEKGKKTKLVYELQSVVNHFGMTPMGGHYTSIVKHNGDGYDWIHVDDSNVYKFEEKNLVTAGAYILVYKLKTV